MRNRRMIEEEFDSTKLRDKVLLETLLDIRQLLAIMVINTETGATAASIRDVAKNT